jgi:transcriptional regulator with XRE-family HTH domain
MPENAPKRLRAVVRAALARQDRLQKDLAEKIGMSETALSNLLNQKTVTLSSTLDNFEQIEQELGLPRHTCIYAVLGIDEPMHDEMPDRLAAKTGNTDDLTATEEEDLATKAKQAKEGPPTPPTEPTTD